MVLNWPSLKSLLESWKIKTDKYIKQTGNIYVGETLEL